jgi:integrase/recombinase XerC
MLKLLFLKSVNGNEINETGFDHWSTHRLRHTMASNLAAAGADVNLILTQGGWKSVEVMSGYTDVDSEMALRGYDEAMRRSNENRRSKSTKRALTLDELLMRAGNASK